MRQQRSFGEAAVPSQTGLEETTMLTKSEHAPIFETLSRVADCLVAMFGKNCEAIVHDLRTLEESVVHVAGNVTGRRIGAPITDLGFDALQRSQGGVEDMINYRTYARDGRALKSSTVFARDAAGAPIACLCINIDTTDFVTAKMLIDGILSSSTETRDTMGTTRETFATSLSETIEALVADVARELGKPTVAMTRAERVLVVRRLRERDVFRLKGAVELVAQQLGVTRFAIYGYLKDAQVRTDA
jgi:predicted transcriptional regulator YheO